MNTRDARLAARGGQLPSQASSRTPFARHGLGASDPFMSVLALDIPVVRTRYADNTRRSSGDGGSD